MKRKKVYVNKKQSEFLTAPQKIKTFQAGRGAGKTTVIGDETYVYIKEMPGSKGYILGKSFGQILNSFLPEIRASWCKKGILEHFDMRNPGHYVVCKKPPRHFAKPYKVPEDYSYVITFFNGTTIALISFDRPEISRGGSYDWGVLDEAGSIDFEKFGKTVMPLLRGNKHDFRHPRRFSLSVFGSMPWKESGMWIVNKMSRLAEEKPDKYFFLQSSAEDNRAVLGDEYFETQREILDPLTYAREIENKHLDKVPHAFYDYLSEDHLYDPAYVYNYNEVGEKWAVKTDDDVNSNMPLEPSFDFNGAFTSCTVWQDHTKSAIKELRTVNAFWIKNTNLDVLIDKFCDYYKSHTNKLVNIYGGRDGHTSRVLSSEHSYYQQIGNRFREKGWNPVIAPDHGQTDGAHKNKHIVINTVLREHRPDVPIIRMNATTCEVVFKSMQRTPILPNFKKDKSSEKDVSLQQEYATHLSDTVDNYVLPKTYQPVMHGINATNDVFTG